tara:strand:+ start:1096 stop:1398 length:303 start_codon:yes stop_codon:yes gene_type:complete
VEHLAHYPMGVGGRYGWNIRERRLDMTKRNYKKEYQQQKKRGDTKGQLERQKARRLLDKNGVNRKGKDIHHKKSINKGGKSNMNNLKLRNRSANRRDNKR